jgi:hypothetical protein
VLVRPFEVVTRSHEFGPRLPNPNPNYFTWSQEGQRTENIRHQSREIIDRSSASLKNNQRDRAPADGLLVWHILIHCDQRFKTGFLGRHQKLAICEAFQPGISARFAVMACEMVAQRLV